MKQFLGTGRVFGNSVLILALAAAMGGCGDIIRPNPYLGYGEGLSQDQVEEQLASGQFTRVDALLTLGPPLRHLEEDRYFVYRLERSHLSFVHLFIPPKASQHFDFYAPHYYLTMEFNPSGELLRYKYFARWKAPSDEEFLDKIFPEWVNEQRTDSR